MFGIKRRERRTAGTHRQTAFAQCGPSAAMGLCFLAQSNWERGGIVPAPSRLAELHGVFGIMKEVNNV